MGASHYCSCSACRAIDEIFQSACHCLELPVVLGTRLGGPAPPFFECTTSRTKDALCFTFQMYERKPLLLICYTIHRQIRGVAIGGTTSAQLACIYCMVRENRFYSQPWPTQARTMHHFFHPCQVPIRPFRFRDNLVGIGCNRLQLPNPRRFFEHMYGLDLQEEGIGADLQTLESHLFIGPNTGYITMGMKDKCNIFLVQDPLRRQIRYPDWFAVNAKTTLRSLAPALARKCVYYSTHQTYMMHNIRRAVHEFRYKGYPRAWWANNFVKSLLKYGMPQQHAPTVNR